MSTFHRSARSLMGLALFVLLFSSCKKNDPVVPGLKDCQVQQFGTTYSFTYQGPHTIPYMFKKTYDAQNRVATMDAYHISENGFWSQNGRFTYKGNMAFVLNNEGSDTLMTIWYNAEGRVIKAEEMSGFKKPFNTHFAYSFTYDAKNRLLNYSYTQTDGGQFPQSGNNPVEYDYVGNCIRVGIFYFEYDYNKAAKRQFYSDLENLNATLLGFRFLQYAGYFPEISNPINVRLRSIGKSTPTSTPFQIGDLTAHQFDMEGNLTSYVYRSQPFPVTYYCPSSVKQ